MTETARWQPDSSSTAPHAAMAIFPMDANTPLLRNSRFVCTPDIVIPLEFRLLDMAGATQIATAVVNPQQGRMCVIMWIVAACTLYFFARRTRVKKQLEAGCFYECDRVK